METVEPVESAVVDALFAEEAVADAAVKADAPVAAETVEANAPVAAETVEADAPVAAETVEADAPVAAETVEANAPVAAETVEADAPVAAETVDADAPVAVEPLVADAPVAAETVEAEAPVAVEPLVADDAVEAEAFAASGSGKESAPESVAVRENELWILGQSGNDFYLYRLQNDAWIAKDAAEFYADAAEFATVVYAHGYQTDMTDATRDAAAFKAVLDAARRNLASERAFRLVVWKWNSERDAARIRVDAQSKAALADWSGKALGRFLGELDPNADLALVGFSFGARVVGSALETLARNGAQGIAFDAEFNEDDEFAFAVSGALVADAAESASNDANLEANEGRKIALVLVAAACDLGSFEARGVYGRGATLPTAVLNVYNPRDFALKYYRHVSETRSDAQGVAPLRTGVFPNAVGKTFNINSSSALGKRHAFVDAIGTIPTQTIGALAF
ncbi:MAG: alpha/beta hydrolase [Thermoguttaceae bacterium]|nr:alpha/beta hydrolase [Thermoguttaceae bacterium]